MSTHPYCRAYPLAELARYDGWREAVRAVAGTELPDDAVVYLRGDYAVVLEPLAEDQRILWSSADAAWRDFCAEELCFNVPAELASAGSGASADGAGPR